MGGGNQAQQQSTALAQQQTQTGQQFLSLAQQELGHGQALEKPLIDFYTGVLSNPQTALAPQLGNINRNTQQAEANVMRSVPGGAGQQAALTQANIQQGQQIAQTENSAITGAYSGLAQLGAAQAGVGLSAAGTGLSGMAGAQQAYGIQEQLQAQEKSSLMGSIGSIVGGVSGGLAGSFSKAGGWGQFGAGAPLATTNSYSGGDGLG